MKKSLKRILTVLMTIVMVLGVYLPISGVALLDAFTVEASAASVSSSETGYWKAFIPAGVKVQGYETATSTVKYRNLPAKDYDRTVDFTAKYSLSDGSVRYYLVDSEGNGIYFIVPSSVSVYRMPGAIGSVSRGIACQSALTEFSFDDILYADRYDVKLTCGDKVYADIYAYADSSSTVRFYVDLGELVEPRTLIARTFTMVVKPERKIGSNYYSSVTCTRSFSMNDCQFISAPVNYCGIHFLYNDGSENGFYQDWPTPCKGSAKINNTVPTRNGYTFVGWSKDANATSASYYPGDTVNYDHENMSLYAVWKKNVATTYNITYNANGGSGAPSAQTKTKDVTLKLSSTKPTKSYKITYNANGGSVSSSSKTVNCTFKNWNTAQNGSGTAYSSGASYTANSGATLYAQWSNPTAGTLPTPTRTGYTFDGWYTSASGGTKITSGSTITANTTLYAHWSQNKEDIYNLGEESYSFSNFGDTDSPGGHCFGMSVTSSAYYLKELDIASVGGNYEQDVYALDYTAAVRRPICYYQDIQDSRRDRAMVAGGSYYKTKKYNISSDWTEVVNYVKNHNYDNKGSLQIGFRKDGEGGHAINFLYYAEVDGQARIYAYDNNFPNVETYFYMDSSGNVKQAPKSTFSGSIDCIALRSVPKYFDLLEGFDTTRYIYADKDTISIEGTTVYVLEGGVEMGERVMYEVPAGVNQVQIKPLVDNAEFEYLDESYSFGSVNDDTVGVFTLASSNDEGGVSSPGLTIENGSRSIWDIISDFFMMIIELLFGWMF